jgi:hypothetical protein
MSSRRERWPRHPATEGAKVVGVVAGAMAARVRERRGCAGLEGVMNDRAFIIRRLADLSATADREFARWRPDADVTWQWVERQAVEVRAAEFFGDFESMRSATVHLLCLVGNFKRQAPIALGDAPQAYQLVFSFDEEFHLVGLRPDVVVGPDASSIDRLCGVSGLAAATASALLAALFPDRHAIIDSLTCPAAAGLGHALALDIPALPRGNEAAIVSPQAYRTWYLPTLVELSALAGCSLRAIERTLFLLRAERSGYRSWSALSEAFVEDLVRGW